jgi:AcrR family transcriptional regulator
MHFRMSRDDTRERILATASAHFANYGFEGASLRRIAEDAGIKAATIFHHFPGGKAKLFDAIFEDIAETIQERIILRYGADTGLSPVEAIVQMVAAFWDYCADHTDYAKLILLRASGMDRNFASMLEGHARAIVAASRVFIETGQARGELADFDIEHFMLWSCAHPLTVHGAPFLPAFLLPTDASHRMRTNYIEMVRNHVRPKNESERGRVADRDAAPAKRSTSKSRTKASKGR